MRQNGVRWSSALLALWALSWPERALALAPGKTLTQYTGHSWQTEDGLPQNSVHAVLQTRDGYLWLGTEEGLVRFDGVRFTVLDKTTTPAIRNNYIWTLAEDSDGTLWVGTYGGGLSSLIRGELRTLTTDDGLSSDIVRALLNDRQGRVWIGTEAGLDLLQQGKVLSVPALSAFSGKRVNGIAEDRAGHIWIASVAGLFRLRDGQSVRFGKADGLGSESVRCVLEDRRGRIWAGTEKGLSRLAGGRVRTYTVEDGLPGDVVLSLQEDRDGALWVGTDQGLGRIVGEKAESFPGEEGPAAGGILSLEEDREGSLWIGTGGGGLARLADARFTPFTTAEGLSANMVSAVYEDSGGSLWVGTYGAGLNRIGQDGIRIFGPHDGLSSPVVTALGGDRAGNIWIGTRQGLNRYRDGKFTVFRKRDGLPHDTVRAVLEGKDGSLWIGTYGGGLARFRDGTFTRYTTRQGLSHDFVVALLEDQHGALWIGTDGGGLNRLRDGRFTRYTVLEGLGSNVVLDLHEDHDGTLWIGTGGGGLSRFSEDRIRTYTSRDGLFDDVIYRILEDDRGRLWMSSNRGVFTVSLSDLVRFSRGEIQSLPGTSFDRSDGLRSAECNGGVQPAGWKARDGRLWFPTIQGVVVVDPEAGARHDLAPPVVIERVLADGRALVGEAAASVAAGTQRLEFDYTALSFLDPERIRFQYRLSGFDRDWIDAGGRREAHYTNLPPGTYAFSVRACNRDGVWSLSNATVRFRLYPHFRQTSLFASLCGLGILGLAWGLYRFRDRRLGARNRALQTLVNERTKDLSEAKSSLEEAQRRQTEFVSGVSHELLAPLTLIRLYGETLQYRPHATEEERDEYYGIIARESERLTHLIGKVLDFSRIDRGRKLYHLRTGDLAEIVERTIEAYRGFLERQGFSLEVQIRRPLPPVVFDPDAVSEAVLNLLDNAAKYSGESRWVSARLGSMNGRVILEIEDRGIGIAVNERERIFEQFYRGTESSGKGGYGLGLFMVQHIMRAHGGCVELDSDQGKGSRFRLVFQAANSRPGGAAVGETMGEGTEWRRS